MESAADKSCYAAFEIEDVSNDESYYGALHVKLVKSVADTLVDDYERNKEYIAKLPYSAKWAESDTAATYPPAISPTVPAAGNGYETSKANSKTKPLIDWKRQNGEYVQWEIRIAGVVFTVLKDTKTDAAYGNSATSWKELEIIATVNQDTGKYDATTGDDASWPHVLWRVPVLAKSGETYYGAISMTAPAARFMLVKITVQETDGSTLIPEFTNIAALKADTNYNLGTDSSLAIHYKWLVADSPTSALTPKTNGWTWQTSITDGWVKTNSKSINVLANQPLIVEFSGVNSFEYVAVKDTGGTAFSSAKVGLSPLLLAKIVDNVATTEKYTAYYFKAPAEGYGYIAFKDGANLYLGLRIDVGSIANPAARPRTFYDAAALLGDAGDRYTGSISRTYVDIQKQWDDLPKTSAGAVITTLNQNQLIDEVSVKVSTLITATDPLQAVRGAFSVVPKIT